MNSREDYLAVGIRLFAIWLIFVSMQQLAVVADQFQAGNINSPALTGYVLTAALVVVTTLWLWLFPLSIARKFLPVMSEPRSEQGMGADVALTVGITLIGLWALADAVTDSVYYVALHLHAGEYAAVGPDYTPYYWMTGAKIILALLLMFGANGIKTMLVRFRYAGARNLDA